MRKIFCSGHDGMVCIWQGRVQRSTIHGMRQVGTKAHNNIFWVVAKNIVTRGLLSGKELRESVGNILVLGLLGMDTGCGASGSRTTTIPRDYMFGTSPHGIRSPRTAMRWYYLSGLRGSTRGLRGCSTYSVGTKQLANTQPLGSDDVQNGENPGGDEWQQLYLPISGGNMRLYDAAPVQVWPVVSWLLLGGWR